MSEWPTESEAAAMLGTSVKTINRYADKGLIEIRKRARPGKKPENICNPDDLERLKPAAHVVPESADIASALVAVRPEAAFIALMQTISTLIRPASVPLPWITVEEAAAAIGLSPGCLRRAVREKKIDAIRGGPHGALRIRRASLEAFAG